VGEDLGFMPEKVQEKLRDWGILSTRIFYLQKDETGTFLPPSAYPEQAVVCLSNSAMFVSEQQIKDHLLDRMFLDSTTDLSLSLEQYLAMTPSWIQTFQFEDVLEQEHRQPGKLPMDLEDLMTDSRVEALYAMFRKIRGSQKTVRGAEIMETAPVAEIPKGTYRFQFNRHFTFRHATALIPYLKKLGISHCYASPLLKAHPGSLHGYDIIDHNRLNPDIGSQGDFEHFIHTLKSHGLSLIVDIVPNHMGVGSDNHWWMDVLENGPMSEYTYYFDIDWSPLKDELYAKVLLPVLGEQYGIILRNEEIQLRFDAKAGKLSLHYYEHFWPVSPTSYSKVLKHRLDVLNARLGENSSPVLEYQSIIRELEHLPSYMNAALEDVTLYQQEKTRCAEASG